MNRVLLFISLVLTGCYFEPEGEFFKQIPERDYSGLSIDLNSIKDTLYLSTITRLEYKINSTDFTLVGTRATVGSNEVSIDQGGGQSGSFFLNPNEFATGTYKLSLFLIVQSGNGSLADKLNTEVVQVWKEFTLIMDAEQPKELTISRLDTTNGKIIIYWNSYKKWNFQSYTLVKECSKDNYYFDVCDYTIINSKNDTSWIDSNYVGGYVRYRIDIAAADKTTRGSFRSYSWLPKTSFSIDNGKVILNWQQSPFYDNIRSTKIYSPFPPYAYFEEVSNDVSSYQLDTDLELGLAYGITIRVESSDPRQSLQFQPKGFIGKDYFFPLTQPSLFHPIKKIYYGYTQLNGGTNTIMDESLNFIDLVNFGSSYFKRQISSNGQFFITLESRGTGFSLHDTNPESLQLSNEFKLEGILNYDLSVSNTGLLAYSSSLGVFVLDWNTRDIIFSSSVIGEQTLISPSGKYLIIGKNIYQYQSGTFNFMGAISIDYLSQSAFTENDDLIVCSYDGKIKLWDIKTFSIITALQTPITVLWSLSYDPISKRAMVTDSHAHYMVNMQSGSIKKIASENYPVNLINGKLFAPLNGQVATFVAIDYTYFE